MTLQGSVGSAEPWVRGGDRAPHWFTTSQSSRGQWEVWVLIADLWFCGFRLRLDV